MKTIIIYVTREGYTHTKTTTSRVARAKMSAHETLLRQLGSLSTACFAFTTVSNPSPASDMSSG